MKIKAVIRYVCEICGETYQTAEAALHCESRPVSQDKGVKVGDTVMVTVGEGEGIAAKVIEIGVCSRLSGHYLWDWYWHTIVITADLIDHSGTRVLLFDQYETVGEWSQKKHSRSPDEIK